MYSFEAFQELCNELTLCEDLDLITEPRELERFSKDFYDYSPILKDLLKDCSPELVVRPKSQEAIELVASACWKRDVPLTLRGSGTGNYGQCVPLRGGVVMLMGAMTKIKNFDPKTGVITVEPGCLLRDLQSYLAPYGRQLRLVPSTWRSASIGGFVAGGSGGIGSVRWGFLRDPGHLMGLEIITVEESPQRLRLDALEAEALNHAYGTNGIISTLSLSTAPTIPWEEVCIDCEDWEKAVALLHACAHAAIDLNLASLLEKNIVKHLPALSRLSCNKHRLLFLVAPDGITTIQRLADSMGGEFHCLGLEREQSRTAFRELTWNHTTLHMRAVNSQWTYLQMLLPQPEFVFMDTIKQRWGEDLLWHLEVVRQQGAQRLAALPLVKWNNEDRLYELIAHCKDLGAVLFNPHVITVEDGGLGLVDVNQVEAKKNYDPNGLLNPGKLKGWLDV